MKKFCLVSLGCPKNRVDSEAAAAGLLDSGFQWVDDPEDADYILVNTCSFIEDAKIESIETLLELASLKQRRPEITLVAMGCLVQQSGKELMDSMPEIDLVTGTGSFDTLNDLLAVRDGPVPKGFDRFLPEKPMKRVLSQSPSFAYLKVADGCSRTCSFCTIPSIKGPFGSRPVGALFDEAWRLADMGVKELVLVAQDLTQYGRPGRRNLTGLIDRLETVPGIEWIRLMYMYPETLTEGVIRRAAEGGRLLPYFDLPIQHIDDRVLRLMRRGATARSIRRTIDRIRQVCPEAVLRTTLIVGFPGETPEAFDRLQRFIQEMRFHHLGVFPFSPEPGTHAADLPERPSRRLAQSRRSRIMKAQARISMEYNRALLGSIRTVLVEGPSPEHDLVYTGRLASQAPEVDGVVYLDEYEGGSAPFVEVELTRALEYDLVGRPVAPPAG